MLFRSIAVLILVASGCAGTLSQTNVVRIDDLPDGWVKTFHRDRDGRVLMQTFASGDGRARIDVVTGAMISPVDETVPDGTLWDTVTSGCDGRRREFKGDDCHYTGNAAVLVTHRGVVSPEHAILMQAHIAFMRPKSLMSVKAKWPLSQDREAKIMFRRVLHIAQSLQ